MARKFTSSSSQRFSRALNGLVAGPPFSAAFRAKAAYPNNTDSTTICFGSTTSYDYGHAIILQDWGSGNNQVKILRRDTSDNYTEAVNTSVIPGVWQSHVGVWYSDGTARMYVDAIAGTLDSNVRALANIDTIAIGAYLHNGSYWDYFCNDYIADMAIISGAASPAEITAFSRGRSALEVWGWRCIEVWDLGRGDGREVGRVRGTILTAAGTGIPIPIAGRPTAGDQELSAHLFVPAATTINGSLSVTLPVPSLSAAGAVAIASAVNQTLAAPALSAAGAVATSGSLDRSLPLPTLSATGTPAIAGGLSTTLPAPLLSATALLDIAGSAALLVAAPTLTAAAALLVQGGADPTLSASNLAAQGGLGIIGTVDVTLAPPALTAAGAGTITGTLDATLPLPALSATGSMEGAPRTATLDVVLPLPSLSAAGTVALVASTAITLPLPVLSAEGAIRVAAAAALTLAAPTFVADGAVVLAGALAPTLPAPALAANAALAIVGELDVVLPLPALMLTGGFTPAFQAGVGKALGAPGRRLDLTMPDRRLTLPAPRRRIDL